MRFLEKLMKIVTILLILLLIFLIILMVSNKISIKIHTSYILGKLFPYPKMNVIIITVAITFLLLACLIVYLIRKIKKLLQR